MRGVGILVLLAIAVAVVKDIAFGAVNNGVEIIVFGLLIAAILRYIAVASNEDLKRSERRDQ